MMLLVLFIFVHCFSVVKIDNLVNQWQQMGVEAPHDTSLEDALTEVHMLIHPCMS